MTYSSKATNISKNNFWKSQSVDERCLIIVQTTFDMWLDDGWCVDKWCSICGQRTCDMLTRSFWCVDGWHLMSRRMTFDVWTKNCLISGRLMPDEWMNEMFWHFVNVATFCLVLLLKKKHHLTSFRCMSPSCSLSLIMSLHARRRWLECS